MAGFLYAPQDVGKWYPASFLHPCHSTVIRSRRQLQEVESCQGARKRFSEWRQAWEETVENIKAGHSGNENPKEEVRFFDSEN